MDEFEEAICGHNPLYKEGLQDKYYQGAKWAWQYRQAEVDQLKNLLEKDEYAHSLYYENANLQTLVEEKDKRIEEACESINSFFDNQVSTPTPREYANFIAEILETLRGNNANT